MGAHVAREALGGERRLHDLADSAGRGAEHEDAVGEQQRLVDAVRHEHDGGAGLRPDFQEILLQLLARLRVERAERLVHEDEDRLAHQRARDTDALLHAAGELVRIVVREIAEPDELDEMPRDLVPLLDRDAVELQRELDVADHRAPRQQAEVLEHHAGVLARLRHRRSFDGDATFVRRDQSGGEPQQRGLAAAARAEQRNELTPADRRVDAVERHHEVGLLGLPKPHAHGEELAHAVIDDHGRGRRAAPVLRHRAISCKRRVS